MFFILFDTIFHILWSSIFRLAGTFPIGKFHMANLSQTAFFSINPIHALYSKSVIFVCFLKCLFFSFCFYIIFKYYEWIWYWFYMCLDWLVFPLWMHFSGINWYFFSVIHLGNMKSWNLLYLVIDSESCVLIVMLESCKQSCLNLVHAFSKKSSHAMQIYPRSPPEAELTPHRCCHYLSPVSWESVCNPPGIFFFLRAL